MKQVIKNLQKTILIVFLGIISNSLFSQSYSISGKLIDARDSIVPATSIILTNQSDTSFVQGTISDMDGHFTINHVRKGHYLLLIQHLLYEKKCISLNINNERQLRNISLYEKENKLDEISVKASRPFIKMKDNVLSYDASAISEKFIRSNALEVLGDVPGVLLKDESVQLLGISQINIAINGAPTTLSMEQVLNMLKVMPNTNVKEIQVMYAPPAKYNVKGALINIILDKAKTNELNGSVNTGIRQRRKSGAFSGFNLQYAKRKWDINLLYSYDYDQVIQEDEIDIDHTYLNTLYKIEQDMYTPDKTFEHQVQLNSSYRPDSLQTFSFSYTSNYSTNKGGPKETTASFSSVKEFYTEVDTSTSRSTETMHNLKLEYSLADKLNIGTDYTYYSEPLTDNYISIMDGQTTEFKTRSNQTVNKWMLYANHSFDFLETNFSYGANFSYSYNKNYYSYNDYINGNYVLNKAQSTNYNFNEKAASGFVSFSKQFTPHWSADFSLKGEFDRMQKDTLETQTNLWNTFYLYPSLNVSFMPGNDQNHIFQLAMKSYTTYPSYWEISPTIWYTNRYMLVKGNPELQPSQTYTSGLTYIFKRKYMAVLSYDYTHYLITQIPFASSESFNTIVRNENVDFKRDFSLAFILPCNIGNRININSTFVYFHQRMKNSSSKEQAFDRKSGIFVFQCDNAILLNEKHGFKATVSGYYYGGGIQGIYDFDPSYKLSCGLSCNLLKNKAVLALKVDDIFKSQIPDLHINFKNQKSHYLLDQDTRIITATFRYNFGKPIKTKKVETDNSRFKRMK